LPDLAYVIDQAQTRRPYQDTGHQEAGDSAQAKGSKQGHSDDRRYQQDDGIGEVIGAQSLR